ncbi:cytochrome oxidase biogenesis protein Surf1, facilitates heme A insertion [Oceanicola sp. 22II-s10i]|nr:cytochrome oxidase biogenesis protein Surf1, facilitates heme A insertion [Oceanicola sp. 22II-s10i]
MVLVVGLGGVAVLLSLGTWQVQRLQWKQEVLADIEARIAADPVALPDAPDPEADRYLPVQVTGVPGAPILQVLASAKNIGAAHRLIVPFETEGGRRILVDLGFLRDGEPLPGLPPVLEVTGNLHWPDEVDGFTPEPDTRANLWFARDVPRMAAALDTEPLLVVRRSGTAIPGLLSMPVDTAGIPNDHFEYAVTWFGLAAIWLAMTGFLVYRMRKTPRGTT